MGLIDFIFGKGTEKSIRAARKAFGGKAKPKRRGAPKTAVAKQAVTPRPKLKWSKQADGTEIVEHDGFRLTVFEEMDGVWNYKLAEIIDPDDQDEDYDPEEYQTEGIGYDTRAEAKREALAELI